MDHRIAERRQHVSEDKARGRLRVLIWIVVVVLVVGLGIWLVNSPLLSIRDVTVTGANRSNPEEIAASVGIEPGVPTIGVRTGSIEDALSSDPWIADAKVVVSWPGAIEIDVVERAPVASIVTADGAYLVAADGVLLEPVEGGSLPPLIHTDTADRTRVGLPISHRVTKSAIEFVAALPSSIRRSASLTVIGDRVEANVAGFRVVVGRPNDMAAKAAAVGALISAGLEPGSWINVTAPTRPAVTPPQSQLEGETKTLEESQPSD